MLLPTYPILTLKLILFVTRWNTPPTFKTFIFVSAFLIKPLPCCTWALTTNRAWQSIILLLQPNFRGWEMDQFFCRRLRKRPTASTLVHSKTLQKKRQTMTEKGLDVETATAATAAEPELTAAPAAAAAAAAAAEKNKTLIKLYCPTKVQVKLQIKHQH